jgi:hypothetical protein
MDLQFDLIREDEADALVAMVRAHHAADDNPHSRTLKPPLWR